MPNLYVDSRAFYTFGLDVDSTVDTCGAKFVADDAFDR